MYKNPKLIHYIKAYKWSNVYTMIKNNRLAPKICTDTFQGKLVVITGATSGIGYRTARKYAAMGASLICINRNLQKSLALCADIERDFGVRCSYMIADFSVLHDCYRVAEELVALKSPIDVIIHNAGVYLTKRELTKDGLEKVFAVHYLSSFLMNYLLMDKLKSQEAARIIMVGSEGHRFAAWGIRLDDLNFEKQRYSGMKSYGTAKTAQLLSMIEFNKRFINTGVTINTMHPGAVKTETGQENGPVYKWLKRNFLDKSLKSPEISAEALYYLGVSNEVKTVSGSFFNLTTLEVPAPPALDKEVALELWQKSLELTGLIK